MPAKVWKDNTIKTWTYNYWKRGMIPVRSFLCIWDTTYTEVWSLCWVNWNIHLHLSSGLGKRKDKLEVDDLRKKLHSFLCHPQLTFWETSPIATRPNLEMKYLSLRQEWLWGRRDLWQKQLFCVSLLHITGVPRSTATWKHLIPTPK